MSIRIHTRKEFADHYNKIRPGLGKKSSPLWIPDRNSQCLWFVSIPRILEARDEYWTWCNANLLGKVRCFSSSEGDQWWGFAKKDDIAYWLLRWM